jgi:NADP-dependent 3-hydroxy acid dehydrogenase YdfG
MKLDLDGRIAMITGPAKGMGASITKAFAAEGAKLALIGRDIAAIEPVAAEVKSSGAQAIVVACDLTDSAQCEQAAEKTKAAFGGRIDILVNVAGGSGPVGKTGLETTPEEFDDIVKLNMNGCFHTMRGVLPTMIAQRYGKSSMSAVLSACADAPAAWPIRRRNGACAASPRASRSRSANTISTSITSRPAWSTVRGFATKSAPIWPSALA